MLPNSNVNILMGLLHALKSVPLGAVRHSVPIPWTTHTIMQPRGTVCQSFARQMFSSANPLGTNG